MMMLWLYDGKFLWHFFFLASQKNAHGKLTSRKSIKKFLLYLVKKFIMKCKFNSNNKKLSVISEIAKIFVWGNIGYYIVWLLYLIIGHLMGYAMWCLIWRWNDIEKEMLTRLPAPVGGVLTDKWYTGMLKGFEVHFRKIWYVDGWVIVTYPMRPICKIGCILENLAKKHPICPKLGAFCRKMV